MRFCSILLVLFFASRSVVAEEPPALELLEVRKVWDRAPHNAFTDLIRWRGQWWLTFREGPTHGVPKVGQPPGKARLLRSNEGKDWESAALLDHGANQDVRDPKLSITPEGRLMLVAAVAPHKQPNTRQSLAWFSDDGETWRGPHEIGEPNWWMWRVTWSPEGKAYGVGYGPTSKRPRTTRLYQSDDGRNFQTLVKQLNETAGTGEVTIRFLSDGEAVALVRCDGNPPHALVGVAEDDNLKQWTFQSLGVRLGGPNFIELPDGRLLAAGRRRMEGGPVTMLGWLDAKAGEFTDALELPSGGDTSYPGLVFHDGELWVSYYSSHEGKTSIYLARVGVK